jgi:hypothetical protein
MSRGSSKRPPVTRNPEAQRLITLALSKCEGCRQWWRLAKGSYRHRTPKQGWDCTAREERDTLREIAALARLRQQVTQ